MAQVFIHNDACPQRQLQIITIPLSGHLSRRRSLKVQFSGGKKQWRDKVWKTRWGWFEGCKLSVKATADSVAWNFWVTCVQKHLTSELFVANWQKHLTSEKNFWQAREIEFYPVHDKRDSAPVASCPTRWSLFWYGVQQCSTAMFYSNVLQQCTTAMYYSNVLQQCTTAMYYNNVLMHLWLNLRQSVPHFCHWDHTSPSSLTAHKLRLSETQFNIGLCSNNFAGVFTQALPHKLLNS